MSLKQPWKRAAAVASIAALALASAASAGERITPQIYDPQTLAALPKIIAAAHASHTAYDVVAHLSDEIGPRLSGSPQAQAAVEYMAQKMRDLGLSVWLEPVTVPHWVRGEETAALVDWPGRAAPITQRIVLTALGNSSATPPAGLIAPVVVVHDYAELEQLGRAVQDKIVLFDVRFSTELAESGEGGAAYESAVRYRNEGPARAARLGAAAALVRSIGGAEFRLPHAGITIFPHGVGPIPAAALAAEDADLIGRLATRGPVRMRLTLTPKRLPDVQSANVIGDLPGSTDPQDVVIVSGHLDSWDLGRGAIDDGAGLAQAVGAMSVFEALGLHPRRTIRCVAWMTEEAGGIGGEQYARDEAAHVLRHAAAIESDVGADHPLGVGTVLGPAVAPWLEPVALALEPQGSQVVRYDQDSETDVDPLARLGVPEFSILQDSRRYFDYHHTAADTLDKIDPTQLAQNTAVIAALAYALADARVPAVRRPHDR